MRNGKKLLSLILALTVLAGFCGCRAVTKLLRLRPAPEEESAAGAVTGEDASTAAESGTLTKDEITALIEEANDLTIGWLDYGFTVSDCLNSEDTLDVEFDEYTIPFFRVEGAEYDTLDALLEATDRIYTAAAAAVYTNDTSQFRMADGKLYCNPAVGQGAPDDPCRFTVKPVSLTEDECLLQFTYYFDSGMAEKVGRGGYEEKQDGDLMRTEDVRLVKEDGLWKFDTLIHNYNLYFDWISVQWEEN